MLQPRSIEFDNSLLSRARWLAEREQGATVEIVLTLAAIEKSSSHIKAGYSSLYAYTTIALGYAEPSALRRIKASRCINRFPLARQLFKDRKLNTSTLCALADILTPENAEPVLREAAGKTKAEVDILAARFRPVRHHELRDRVENVFVRCPQESAVRLELQSEVHNGGSAKQELENYLRNAGGDSEVERKVRYTFVAAPQFSDKVNRMRELLSNKYSNPELAQVLMEAMDCYIKHHDPVEKIKRKTARLSRAPQLCRSPEAPAENVQRSERTEVPRYIPAAVVQDVYARDGFRCTYVSPSGHRCESRHALQVDHIQPHAAGGSNNPENLRLLCRVHNRAEAERWFGEKHMRQFRRADSHTSPTPAR